MFYPDPLTNSEPQYAYIMPNCLAVVEMDIGICVASLVVMRPAFQALYQYICPKHKLISLILLYTRSKDRLADRDYRAENISRSRKRGDELYILETIEIAIPDREIIDKSSEGIPNSEWTNEAPNDTVSRF